jgi:adenine phosphoribosyltransferase
MCSSPVTGASCHERAWQCGCIADDHLSADALTPEQLLAFIRDIPDFPRAGVVFKDITPLLADARALRSATERMAAPFAGASVTKVVGIEARGFVLAAPIALQLGAGLIPVRKAGKLPWDTHAYTYDLEYGTDTLEVHRDAFRVTDRVLVVDDVLATGGTADAAAELVGHFGATLVGVALLLELAFLQGRSRLRRHGVPVEAVLHLP